MARARECVVEVGRCILKELSTGLSAERLHEFLSMLALTRLCSMPINLNGLRSASKKTAAASTQKTARPGAATRQQSAFASAPASNSHPEAPFHELYYVAEAALALYCSRLGNLFAQFNGAKSTCSRVLSCSHCCCS